MGVRNFARPGPHSTRQGSRQSGPATRRQGTSLEIDFILRPQRAEHRGEFWSKRAFDANCLARRGRAELQAMRMQEKPAKVGRRRAIKPVAKDGMAQAR